MTAVVNFHVKPGAAGFFRDASLRNARESRKEPGVAGFRVLQLRDDPESFLFIETYRTPQDQLSHRETEHYKRWKAETAEMLSGPYTVAVYEDTAETAGTHDAQ